MAFSKTNRIFIVDDHPLIRHGLFHAVSSVNGFAVCGMAGSVAEALRVIAELQPDGMILDMHLPDGDGLGLLHHLSALNLQIPTLILSVCDESVYAPRMFSAGARGFLMKDAPLDEILAALRKIFAGHLAFSDAVVTRLLSRQQDGVVDPLDQLSNQELTACRLLGMGMRNKEVAARMNLSAQTIGTYKNRILRKLGLSSQYELEAFMRLHAVEDSSSTQAGDHP